jgi:hypothetical protein
MRTDRRALLIGIAAAGVEFPDPVGGNPGGRDSVHRIPVGPTAAGLYACCRQWRCYSPIYSVDRVNRDFVAK